MPKRRGNQSSVRNQSGVRVPTGDPRGSAAIHPTEATSSTCSISRTGHCRAESAPLRTWPTRPRTLLAGFCRRLGYAYAWMIEEYPIAPWPTAQRTTTTGNFESTNRKLNGPRIRGPVGTDPRIDNLKLVGPRRQECAPRPSWDSHLLPVPAIPDPTRRQSRAASQRYLASNVIPDLSKPYTPTLQPLRLVLQDVVIEDELTPLRSATSGHECASAREGACRSV